MLEHATRTNLMLTGSVLIIRGTLYPHIQFPLPLFIIFDFSLRFNNWDRANKVSSLSSWQFASMECLDVKLYTNKDFEFITFADHEPRSIYMIILRIFDWNLCKISMFEWNAVFHNWMVFSMVLYISNLFARFNILYLT